jgi:hypothetical protein
MASTTGARRLSTSTLYPQRSGRAHALRRAEALRYAPYRTLALAGGRGRRRVEVRK